MSISWGMKERFKFASGGSLEAWVPPALSGVFAVTYKQDPRNKPKSHTVLYFGESEDFSKLTASICNRVVELWKAGGGTAENFFVFFHPMLGSSQFDRHRVQERLIAEYQPHGNEI